MLLQTRDTTILYPALIDYTGICKLLTVTAFGACAILCQCLLEPAATSVIGPAVHARALSLQLGTSTITQACDTCCVEAWHAVDKSCISRTF